MGDAEVGEDQYPGIYPGAIGTILAILPALIQYGFRIEVTVK